MREIRDLFVRPDAPDFGGESLKRRAEALSERLEELGQKAGSAGLRDAAGNLAAQDRLASQVQQFTYLQIPVMLREKGTTAELYVFRRNGKGKPVDPGATVVMIVLDTEHMGRVETVVRAEDKNVQLKMRVRDRRVAQMLEEKAALMDRALEETGFRLTQMSCRVADAPVTPECAQRVALDLLRDGGPHLDIVI
jgi:flagellar hook-length control protein FliK